MRLLIAEEEKLLSSLLAKLLRRDGYSVDLCHDTARTLELLTTEKYDLILLDLHLPKEGGLAVLQTLRRMDLETAVIIMSTKNQVADKVLCLDTGANDYLVKPFHLAELEARVRSLTRRKFVQENIMLTSGNLSFDTKRRLTFAKEKEVNLTKKEAGLLEYLLLHQGRPVSQEELMEHVWDGSVNKFSNSIRIHISSLRRKLAEALGYDPVKNKVGEGYFIEAEG